MSQACRTRRAELMMIIVAPCCMRYRRRCHRIGIVDARSAAVVILFRAARSRRRRHDATPRWSGSRHRLTRTPLSLRRDGYRRRFGYACVFIGSGMAETAISRWHIVEKAVNMRQEYRSVNDGHARALRGGAR